MTPTTRRASGWGSCSVASSTTSVTALVGLRPVADDRFDEDRVGLDHLCLRVASKAELDAAAAHLDDLGVAHEPIKDIGQAYILEFRDPDHIALELVAPK